MGLVMRRRTHNAVLVLFLLTISVGPVMARAASVCNYRCGGQESRLLTTGGIHFSFYYKLSPWDQAAGWLIHREAGGHSALIDGSPYRPDLRAGGLLMAPDKASWNELATALRG